VMMMIPTTKMRIDHSFNIKYLDSI